MQLSKVQQEAVDFYQGCCNVIASAGSGKTGVLVNRIVKLIEDYNVEPGKILAITFSKKAKENMVSRLTKLIPEYVNFVNIETFHSFGYRIVRQFTQGQFEILDASWKRVRIIEEIAQSAYRPIAIDGNEIAEILQYISVQKNQLKRPNTREEHGRFYKKYEDYKSKRGQLDFDDMLTKCYDILVGNKQALDYCQEKYQFILADEMQDTNAVQYEILKLIGEKHKNVFVVDDPLQSIYEWRGANNKFVLDFDLDWPGAKVIQLNKNYRSSRNIVQTANHFAKCIPESGHKHYVESVANKDEFDVPHYVRFDNETIEADEIANKMNELISAGYNYKDIAVITRTNAQLQCFEAALCRNKIPYTVVDGLSFVDRKEVKIVLSYLRLVYDTDDDEAFEYIYNRPNRFLGNQFLQEVKRVTRKNNTSLYCSISEVIKQNYKYSKRAKLIYRAIEDLMEEDYSTVADIIARLRENLDLDSYVSKDIGDSDDSKVENLNALQNMAENYKDIKRFVSAIMKIAREKKSDTNSVQLMTIHKSKGLEFPVVFVPGVNKGILPHERNRNLDEEKRLMYVAITRAEKELYISSTRNRGGKKADESDFIQYIFGK